MTVTFSSDESFHVTFSGNETIKATLSATIISHEIPSNYGLITWDGSCITVS